MNKQYITISKFLSFVLRHDPKAIGITLDAEGWVPVDELLAAAAHHGQPIRREQLDEVVATNDKKRFSFSPDGRLIRANQGHSVEVDLGLVPVEPPDLLYHGTVERFLDSIRNQGLLRGNRHHVHLSTDRETAARVGQRRGRPVVLVVEAGAHARATAIGSTSPTTESGLPKPCHPRIFGLSRSSEMNKANTGPILLPDHSLVENARASAGAITGALAGATVGVLNRGFAEGSIGPVRYGCFVR